MIKKETVLFHASDKDDKLFLSSVFDCFKRALEKGVPSFTDFMSERKQAMCLNAFSSNKEVGMRFFGGYEGAERKILCFSEGDTDDYPIGMIRARVKLKADLTHRDWLGALMGLGINRDTVGDIIVSENEAFIFAKKEISDYIILNLKEVGKYPAECEITDSVPEIEGQRTTEMTVTVASMRLDCVLSAALNLSRDKAKLLIDGKRVCVNGKLCLKQDAVIDENTVISARGFGRIIAESVKGKSKKGRIIILIKRMF